MAPANVEILECLALPFPDGTEPLFLAFYIGECPPPRSQHSVHLKDLRSVISYSPSDSQHTYTGWGGFAALNVLWHFTKKSMEKEFPADAPDANELTKVCLKCECSLENIFNASDNIFYAAFQSCCLHASPYTTHLTGPC
jgi:hypothetical protein